MVTSIEPDLTVWHQAHGYCYINFAALGTDLKTADSVHSLLRGFYHFEETYFVLNCLFLLLNLLLFTVFSSNFTVVVEGNLLVYCRCVDVVVEPRFSSSNEI